MSNNYKVKKTIIFWLTIPLAIFIAHLSIYYPVLSSREYEQPELQSEPERVDVSDFSWNGEGLITFWFDDAWFSQYQEGYSKMKENDWRAALAVPTHHVEWDAYMNWNQVVKLFHTGWEITAHSRNHRCDLVNYPSKYAFSEIVGSQYDLAQRGILADIYVPPCGVVSDEFTLLVKNHFKAQRVVETGINSLPVPPENRYQLVIKTIESSTNIEEVQALIAQTKRDKGWLILMFHEINENNSIFSTTSDFFEQIIQEVKQSELEVVIPSEALSIK